MPPAVGRSRGPSCGACSGFWIGDLDASELNAVLHSAVEVLTRGRLARSRHHVAKEPRLEGPLGCLGAVAAPLSDDPHSVLLFKSKSRRKRPQPGSNSVERIAALRLSRIAGHIRDHLLRAPDDAALAMVEELAPGVDAFCADERIRIFRLHAVGVHNVDG